eukprot:s989_g19.t1
MLTISTVVADGISHREDPASCRRPYHRRKCSRGVDPFGSIKGRACPRHHDLMPRHHDPSCAVGLSLKHLREYHASLRPSTSARGGHKRRDQIEEIWERRHWLGTLRPYSDAWDIFRDLPMLWASLRFLLRFLTRPLSEFSTEADSAPYFGLLLRLCATQLCFQTLSRDDLAALLTHAHMPHVAFFAAWSKL